jgi:hypothetical protein
MAYDLYEDEMHQSYTSILSQLNGSKVASLKWVLGKMNIYGIKANFYIFKGLP